MSDSRTRSQLTPAAEALESAIQPLPARSAGAPSAQPESGVWQPAWLQSFLDDGPFDVSVCIANWNCREMLRACLESLHDHPQGVRLETIVVDNGSSDGVADMVARDFPEVVLIRNGENLGFARANNQAADRARGRYLFFLNNDTVVPPGTLRTMMVYLDSHPEVGMIGPRLRDAEGQPQVSYRQRPTLAALLHRTYLLRWTGLLRRHHRRYRREEFDPDNIRSVEVLMGAAVLLPREVFFASGRWDEEFAFGGEDIELSVRVGQRRAVVYLPTAEITHYGRVSTRQNVGFTAPNVAVGFVKHLRKSGHSRSSLLLYKLVVTLDAPLQLTVKGLQCAWRRLLGQQARAEKSWLAVLGAWHFLRAGLVAFWRA